MSSYRVATNYENSVVPTIERKRVKDAPEGKLVEKPRTKKEEKPKHMYVPSGGSLWLAY